MRISREEFQQYQNVMTEELKRTLDFSLWGRMTNLPRDKVVYIFTNYGELSKKYAGKEVKMQVSYDPATKRFKHSESPKSSSKEPGVHLKITGEPLGKLMEFAKRDGLLNGKTDRDKKVKATKAVTLYTNQAIQEFVTAREALQ